MKPIQYFINESRSIAEIGISFDVFNHFVDEWILTNDTNSYDEKPKSEAAMDAYNALVDVLKPNTRDYKSAIKALHKYCEDFFAKLNECGVYNIDNSIMQLLYYRVSSLPIKMLENLIGTGEEGVIVELNDKVIKVFFGDKIPHNKVEFYKACKAKKYDVFPEVSHIGKGYVVMEKLKMYTEKCNTYQYIIDKVYHQVYDGKYKLDDYTEEEQEVIKWLESVREAVYAVTKQYNFGDLDEKNFGENKEGKIVYFDI